MKHGYGERWKDISITVDKVGEDAEGNHLVEVSIHDRMDEINVRLFVSKAYYGSMIPWLAARVVVSDLAAGPFERVRRFEARHMENEVWYEDKAFVLQEFLRSRALPDKMQDLPDELLRGNLVYMREGPDEEGNMEALSKASLHNVRRQIFDRGLPDVVEFINDLRGRREIRARWKDKEFGFYGFDWETPLGQHALSDFMGMLNLRLPLDLSDIRPRRIRYQGTKEWSPYDYQTFMLHKGKDYGRPNQV